MSKKQITLELNITPTVADAQIKASAEKIKDALSRVKLDKSNLNVFKELSEWLDVIDAKVSELKKIDAVQFDKLYGGASGDKLNKALKSALEPYLSVPENIGKSLAEARQHLDNMRSKIGSTNKEDLQELKDSANAIREIYKSMGKEVPAELNFSKKQKVTEESLAVLDNALKNLSITWDEVIQKTREFDSSTGGKASNAVKKVANGIAQGNSELQVQIDKLESEKKRYQEVIDALNGKNIKIKTTKKDDVAQVKELVEQFLQAKEAVQQYEIAKNTSGNSYKYALAEEYKLAVLLKNTMDDVSVRGSNDAVSYIMEQSTTSYDQAEKTIERFGKLSSDFKQSILNSYKQGVVEVDAEIAKIKNLAVPNNENKVASNKNLATSYDILNEKLREYYELNQQLRNVKEGSNEFNRLSDRQRAIQDEIYAMKQLTEAQENSFYNLWDKIDDGGVPKLKDAVAQFCNILQIDIPNAAEQSATSVTSAFGEIINKAEQLNESIKKVCYSASEIEVSTRNGLTNGRESMNLFSLDGSVSTAYGTDYQVDTDSLVQQVVANLNKNIIMSLHNHANGDMAFSPADINSFARLYYGQGAKINGIIANGIVQTIDFSSISQEVAINIAKDYQDGIRRLFETGNISQYVSMTDEGIMPTDMLKQIQSESTAKYQEIISGLQEAMTVVLRQSFEKNGAEFTWQAFSVDNIEELTTYLTNLQQSANSTLEPVEKLKNLITTLRPDVDLNAFTEIFDKFQNGAIDGSKALEMMLESIKSVGQDNNVGLNPDKIQDGTTAIEKQTAAIERNNEANKQAVLEQALKSFTDFQTLTSDIQSSWMTGTMNSEAIGKYITQIDMAKTQLQEFANQGLITAEQMEQVNSMYEESLKQINLSREANNAEMTALRARPEKEGEPSGSYDSGFDDGYSQGQARAAEEIDELQKTVASLQKELSNKQQASVSGIDSTAETTMYETLKGKITEVITEINAKTEAFKTEGATVDGVVSQEIAALDKLLAKVNEIKGAADKIGNTASKTTRPTLDANARIADTRQYEQIRDVTLNAIGDRGTESKITGMKALADGIVQVNGYIKTAEGNYENFVVKVNTANEAIGLAFSENQKLTQQMQAQAAAQKAFSNNLNLVADEFAKYKSSIDQSDQITAKFSNQIQQMENRLSTVSNGTELDKWKADWDALTASIEAAKQEQEKLILAAQKRAVNEAYGATQVKNIKNKYTQLSGVAKGAEFADSAIVQAALANLEAAYDRLAVKQKEFVGIDPTKQQQEEFARLTDQYNQAYRALDKLIKSSRKLQERGVGDPYDIVSGTNMADENIRRQELQNAVNLFSNGTAEVGRFNNEVTTLSYTVKNADGTFTDFTAMLDATGTKIVNVAGKAKESTSLFKGAFDSIKKKSKEILTYMVSMGGLYRVFNQIRQGVRYVKEIDSALTELKKVTDETDETYAQFLKTASAAGAEIGTTISEFVNATADFARLGYSISEATELAKAASVYKNVGDGITDVSQATESIISTMKANICLLYIEICTIEHI